MVIGQNVAPSKTLWTQKSLFQSLMNQLKISLVESIMLALYHFAMPLVCKLANLTYNLTFVIFPAIVLISNHGIPFLVLTCGVSFSFPTFFYTALKVFVAFLPERWLCALTHSAAVIDMQHHLMTLCRRISNLINKVTIHLILFLCQTFLKILHKSKRLNFTAWM